MLIQLLNSAAGPTFGGSAGDIVDVANDLATQMIAAGSAKYPGRSASPAADVSDPERIADDSIPDPAPAPKAATPKKVMQKAKKKTSRK